MDLCILRHGRAGDRREWDGDDRQRPLTAEGVERTTAVLCRLRDAIALDAIWTSPWIRARETAEIAGRIWELEPEDQPWLAGDAAEPDLVVDRLDPQLAPGRLMLVGHEPSLSELVGHLAGCPPLPLKKAGLALLDGRVGAGTMHLRSLLTPRLVLDLT